MPETTVTDFPELLRRLEQYKVEYIIVGGVASVVHGSSRLTQDLDVVYRRSRANFAALISALHDVQPYLRGAPPGWRCFTAPF